MFHTVVLTAWDFLAAVAGAPSSLLKYPLQIMNR